MMIYPSMPMLLDKVNSRYMLVNVIAKRARAISAEAEENGEHLDVKPVTLAINDIAEGKVQVRKIED